MVRDGDRVRQVMVVAIVVNLAAYTFSATISGVDSARELAAVLPLGAVLVARLTAQRLIAGKHIPVVLAAVLACAGILAYNAGRPPSPAAAQNVADWLAARHLSYGLGGYWQANNITLASAGRIEVRPVSPWMDRVGQYRWESKDSWYNPGLHDATFLVIDTTSPRNAWYATASEARATYGPPVSSCNLGEYTVLIWNNNLLGHLGRQPCPPGPRQPRQQDALAQNWRIYVPPSTRFDRLLHLLIELDRDDLDVLARSESMDQPGKPGAGADLQNPGHRSVPLRPVPRGREAEPVPGGGGDESVCSPRSGPGNGG